ncbi:MAG: hypothetical protein LBS75_08565 [Synergistaceae bacterium]|nr:hypothetical protein [Synergistaceae bacterium]
MNLLKMWNRGAPRASESFYRNVFAIATFTSFAAALATDSPAGFMAALAFGALSRTAARKNWKNPAFAARLPWLARPPREESGTR